MKLMNSDITDLARFNYSFLKTIGKGSYGEVWLCKHIGDGKQYVIKKIDISKSSERERKAAALECKLLSQFKHPNIVPYKDSFECNGFLFIAMGYCEGGDLYRRLQKQNEVPLSERQIMEWFVQMVIALQYMHQRHILHRDLKTQNIFLTRMNIIKIGDLGIARVLESSSAMATTLIGTPYYMSPELFASKPYNHKSDIWALGCVLYEMTTLRHAFNAKSFNALSYKIMSGKIPDMPTHYSPELVELMRCMLNLKPEKRPSARKILSNSFIRKNIILFLEETKNRKQTITDASKHVKCNHELHDYCESFNTHELSVGTKEPNKILQQNDHKIVDRSIDIIFESQNEYSRLPIHTSFVGLRVNDIAKPLVQEGHRVEDCPNQNTNLINQDDSENIFISKNDVHSNKFSYPSTTKDDSITAAYSDSSDISKVSSHVPIEQNKIPVRLESSRRGESQARLRRRQRRHLSEASCDINKKSVDVLRNPNLNLIPNSYPLLPNNHFHIIPVSMLPKLHPPSLLSVKDSILESSEIQNNLIEVSNNSNNNVTDRGYSSIIQSIRPSVRSSNESPDSNQSDVRNRENGYDAGVNYEQINFLSYEGQIKQSTKPFMNKFINSQSLSDESNHMTTSLTASESHRFNSVSQQIKSIEDSEKNLNSENHLDVYVKYQDDFPNSNETTENCIDDCGPTEPSKSPSEEQTINRSIQMRQRFVELHKYCIENVGLSRLIEVYEILDQDLSSLTQESYLKNILGSDLYLKYMGKIWQLWLFEKLTFSS